MEPGRLRRAASLTAVLCLGLALSTTGAAAQAPAMLVTRIDLPIGRSYPIETTVPVTQVSVATPDVADVVVIDARNVVINAKAAGETDVILWAASAPRRHYRVQVHSPSDRQQIAISVKIAEVRRDLLREIGVSALRRDGNSRIGTGIFNTDAPFDANGGITVPSGTGFGTVLTDFGTDRLLALLEAEEQKGNAHVLAEPRMLAANKEQASFLAGGELPIPIVQGGGTVGGASPTVTILWREFGVRLNFTGEVVSDDLIKLKVAPEVSSLDYANAITLSGASIPALRTRKMESTIDMRNRQSLIISGLFNEEREKVKTGVPYLMNVPILGQLFSSTRWQNNESELLVIVTPTVVDPMNSNVGTQPGQVLPTLPDTTLPARESIQKRLPPGPGSPSPRRR